MIFNDMIFDDIILSARLRLREEEERNAALENPHSVVDAVLFLRDEMGGRVLYEMGRASRLQDGNRCICLNLELGY